MHQVATLSVGQGTYFTTTGREDYYLKGGEPLGLWRAGAGSDALGVHGIVHASEFHNLLYGFSADGSERLVSQQNFPKLDEHGQKLREKCAAHDLTFSAPKTYSVVRAVVPPELAAHMDQAMRRALDRSLDFVQDEAGFSRKKVAGEIKPIRADLAFAMFEHRTSRSLDPHWHYHCVIPNVARCEDGKFRTVNGYNFYQLQHASWHVFEAEFAKELRALGFHIVRKGKSFEIAGVPEALCEEFSKRRHEILRAVEEFGSASGKVRELAALSTREVKQAVPHELLYKALTQHSCHQGQRH